MFGRIWSVSSPKPKLKVWFSLSHSNQYCGCFKLPSMVQLYRLFINSSRFYNGFSYWYYLFWFGICSGWVVLNFFSKVYKCVLHQLSRSCFSIFWMNCVVYGRLWLICLSVSSGYLVFVINYLIFWLISANIYLVTCWFCQIICLFCCYVYIIFRLLI